jgi:single-strand DNA-binding protein
MKTFNNVILMGYVATEPTEKEFDNGTKCVNISLKTRDFYSSNGEKKVDKNFHNLILWNGKSEMATTIIEKGDVLHVVGHLKNKKVIDPQSGKSYFKTEVVIQEWTKITIEDKSEPEE